MPIITTIPNQALGAFTPSTTLSYTGLTITIPAKSLAILHFWAGYANNPPLEIGIGNTDVLNNVSPWYGFASDASGINWRTAQFDTTIVNTSDIDATGYIFAKYATSTGGNGKESIAYAGAIITIS